MHGENKSCYTLYRSGLIVGLLTITTHQVWIDGRATDIWEKGNTNIFGFPMNHLLKGSYKNHVFLTFLSFLRLSRNRKDLWMVKVQSKMVLLWHLFLRVRRTFQFFKNCCCMPSESNSMDYLLLLFVLDSHYTFSLFWVKDTWGWCFARGFVRQLEWQPPCPSHHIQYKHIYLAV